MNHHYLFLDQSEDSERTLSVLQLVEDALAPGSLSVVPLRTPSGSFTALSKILGVVQAPTFLEVEVLQDACDGNGCEQELIEQSVEICSGFEEIADNLLTHMNV